MGEVQGVLCHHTTGPKVGNMPTLNLLIEGRPDLAGPLAQLGLGRDGTFYVVAAGLCNHAGDGAYRSIVAGNTHLIGIEAENTGKATSKATTNVWKRTAIMVHEPVDRGRQVSIRCFIRYLRMFINLRLKSGEVVTLLLPQRV